MRGVDTTTEDRSRYNTEYCHLCINPYFEEMWRRGNIREHASPVKQDMVQELYRDESGKSKIQ